jgi:hypothetical protein
MKYILLYYQQVDLKILIPFLIVADSMSRMQRRLHEHDVTSSLTVSLSSMVEPMISVEGAARVFVGSIKGWGQAASMVFFLDLIVVLACYYSVRPNTAIKILLIGATLKGITILPYYIVAGYTPDYSEAIAHFITVTLEIGWFFYDHVVSISTLHRVLVFYKDNTKARYEFLAIKGVSLVFGAILRLFRSTCRFGKCIAIDAGACDALIATNVLICEFFLLGALIYKCTLYKKGMVQEKGLFEAFIQESYLRLIVNVPLGSMEATAYIFERIPGTPTAFVWFLVIGIIARQFSCSILALTILSTRVSQQSRKGTIVSKGAGMQSTSKCAPNTVSSTSSA